MKPEECMMSFDVEALFTSVPIEPAISITKKHLEEDKDLHQRTTMTVNTSPVCLNFALQPHILLSRVGCMNKLKELLWDLP